MNVLTRVLSGVALVGALSVPAFAEQSPPLPNGTMLIIWPDGTMAQVHVLDSNAVDSAMQHASQTTQPTMVIVQNGHAYLVPDQQMSDGKMMSDDMSDTSKPGISNANKQQ